MRWSVTLSFSLSLSHSLFAMCLFICLFVCLIISLFSYNCVFLPQCPLVNMKFAEIQWTSESVVNPFKLSRKLKTKHNSKINRQYINLRRLHRSKKNYRKIIFIGQIIGSGQFDSFMFVWWGIPHHQWVFFGEFCLTLRSFCILLTWCFSYLIFCPRSPFFFVHFRSLFRFIFMSPDSHMKFMIVRPFSILKCNFLNLT